MLGNLAKASIEVIPDQFTQLCISAMFTLAFHGFLRIGEITVRSGVPAEHVIQWKDLVVVPDSTRHGKFKPSLQLTILQGKHQKVGKPIVFFLGSIRRLESTRWPTFAVIVKPVTNLQDRFLSFLTEHPSHAHISHRN